MTADAHDSIWDPAKGQELAIQLLELLGRRRGARDTIENALTLVQEHTEFEVVGVRLREGDDYPYYVTSGSSAGRCEAERTLCGSPGGGDTARNATGVPILECFCGAVISGQVDPSHPWFTAAGSFWSNNAARTASSMPSNAIPPGFRGRCFQDGYESIALIPLCSDQEITGLLQLCDTRPDRLTLELVRCLERLGASIGVSIRRAQTEQEQITAIQGICRNIEEQKRTETELKLMARIVAETREGVALVDLDGNMLQVNEAFAAMHGYCPAELLGKNLSIFHTPEQMPAVLAANRQIQETGYFDGEVWHIRRDGTRFLTLMHNTVMRDEEGRPEYMLGTMVDISNRKRLEEATRVQRDLAVALNSARSIDDGLELCLKAAIEVSGMDSGAIYLVDSVSGDVDLAVQSGLPPEFIELVKHYPCASSRAELVRQGDSLYWCRDTMGLLEDVAATAPDLRSVAILPIHHQGQSIACLNLASQTLTEIPTTTRHGLESIAGQIAGAIARLTAEEAAQRKQDLIAAVLDHSPAIVYVKDLEGRYQLASQTLAKLIQVPLPEIVGKTDYELYAKEAAAVFRENDRRVLEHGGTLQAEEMLVVDGEDRYFLSTKFAVRAPDGTPVLTAGISVDATDRKRIQNALQKSEERYRAFVTSGPQGMWCYKIDPPMPTNISAEEQIAWTCAHATLEECNDAYAQMHGFASAQEAVGHRYVDLLGGNEAIAEEVIRIWVAGEYAFDNVELEQMSRFESSIWTLVSGVGFLEDGHVVRTWGTVIDITDRKLAEQQLNMSLQRLEESEAHLKRAQQVSHMGSWQWDIEPDVVHWSEEIFRVFGVDPESFKPSFAAILTRTPSENRSFVQQRVRDILNDDEAGSFDQRIVRPSGEVRHIHVQAKVIRDPEGNPIVMEGTVIDITERKNAEAALQQAQRLSAIGTLAAGIAHEINNPIGSALLAAETVLATKDVPEKKEIADRCLEEIIRSLERCGDIVRSVLKFSRDDVCERRRLQINDVVRQATDQTRLYAVRRDISIKLDLGDDLPKVPANHLEMELAVSNVLRNALETEGHSKPIEIRTRLTQGGVLIAVQDWGAGMSKDVRDHLFDPFFTTRLKKGGTGLGASIAYGIVKSHNGTIQVESRPGEGTLTSITLPFMDTVSE
jgi:PAS domain S-box-containing protein